MMTTAKGLTNAAVPMGAVLIRREIHDALMHGPGNAIELFHGYTYSGHPVACAAALATLDIYAREGLFERAAALAPAWEEAVHSLKGLPHIVDIRNLGLVAAIEFEPRADGAGKRGYDIFVDCFQSGLQVRVTGDIIALSPPLIVSEEEIGMIVEMLGAAIRRAA
jgi:beta-alanine--pyruvate transaminase